MGTAGGGVWKTEDSGNSWYSISDGYFGGSIGAVAVSESDPKYNLCWRRRANSKRKCFIWKWIMEKFGCWQNMEIYWIRR